MLNRKIETERWCREAHRCEKKKSVSPTLIFIQVKPSITLQAYTHLWLWQMKVFRCQSRKMFHIFSFDLVMHCRLILYVSIFHPLLLFLSHTHVSTHLCILACTKNMHAHVHYHLWWRYSVFRLWPVLCPEIMYSTIIFLSAKRRGLKMSTI